MSETTDFVSYAEFNTRTNALASLVAETNKRLKVLEHRVAQLRIEINEHDFKLNHHDNKIEDLDRFRKAWLEEHHKS